MNRKLLDQFQACALPELLEDSLEEGDAHCIAFNRWGTLLAAGLQDGRVVFWDMDTRGVARDTQMHTAAVTHLAFSSNGRLLVAAATDGSAKLWNLELDVQEGELSLGQHILSVSLHRQHSHLCLVSFPSIAPSLIDFKEERSQTLPCLQIDLEKGSRPVSTGTHDRTSAIFSRSGELVFLTLSNGCVAVLTSSKLRFIDIVKVPGGARAANLALSKNGKHLIVNYQDRVIRAFEVLEDTAGERRTYSLPELRGHLTSMAQMPLEGSILYPESPLLRLASHSFQNLVTKNSWQCAAFSCDCEHVAAASASRDAHHINIWTRWGRLERILEGPTIGVRHLAWHPSRPLAASVAASGAIYLWARVQAENWSAFAPDFTELQENEEYIEPEDVFDSNSKQNGFGLDGHGRHSGVEVNDTAAIDILTQEPDNAESSDLEADLDAFRRLPVMIIPQAFDSNGLPTTLDGDEGRGHKSASPSSFHESEPVISDAGDSRAPSAGVEDPVAPSVAGEDQGFKLRPGRQKRYHEELEDEDYMETEFPDIRRQHIRPF